MPLELTDEQTEALMRELSRTIEADHYPFSRRILVLREILDKLRPAPPRPEPLPPPRHYKPPRASARQRR